MFLLKRVLSLAELRVHVHSGDILHVTLHIGGKCIFDRQIDFIKGA